MLYTALTADKEICEFRGLRPEAQGLSIHRCVSISCAQISCSEGRLYSVTLSPDQ